MTDGKDDLRASESELLAALRDAGADVARPKAMKCPFHEDNSPSAGVYFKDGVWRFKCQAASCGVNYDVFDVMARASGRKVEDVLKDYNRDHADTAPRRPAAKPAEVKKPKEYESIDALKNSFSGRVRIYNYTDPATGNVDLIKVRVEPPGGKKFFLNAHLAEPGKDGRVIATAPPKPWPLFNRKRMLIAEEVWFVEGEKCVEALTRAGHVATCVSGGGGIGSPKHTDLTPLHGKRVYFWPDHDAPDEAGIRGGHRHMREVIEECKLLGVKIDPFWIDPDMFDLGEKEDVADYLAMFEPAAWADALDVAKDTAAPMGPSAKYDRYIEDAIDGKRLSVHFPDFPALTRLSKALRPGSGVILCGAGGSTKSMFIMQCISEWTLQGIRCAVYMLEDDVYIHVDRAVAQKCGNSRFTDDDWKHANPDESRKYAADWRHLTNDLLERIDVAPDEPPTHEEVLAWIKRRCEEGCRVIVVDPISIMDGGRESHREDLKFIIRSIAMARRHGASLIFVTHPRPGYKGNVLPTLDDMAGGRSYPRFAHTVFWLKSVRDAESNRKISGGAGIIVPRSVDRLFHLLKVRNGPGDGVTVAFTFDKSCLRFTEIGIDLGKQTKNKPRNEDADDEVPV